jgi:hypothetical protein
MKILKYLILIALTSCTPNHEIDSDKSQNTIDNQKIIKDLQHQINQTHSYERINNRIFQIFLVKQNIEYSDYVLTYVRNYEEFTAIKPDGYCLIDSEYVFIYNGGNDIFSKDTSIISKTKILKTKKLYKDKKDEEEHLLVGDCIYSKYYRINHKNRTTEKIDTFYDIHSRISFPSAKVIQTKRRN